MREFHYIAWHVCVKFPKRANHYQREPLKIFSIALSLIFLLSPLSSAHDYWFNVEGQDYVLHRGHHLMKHEGENIIPYDPAIIQRTYCRSSDGIVRMLNPPFPYPTRISGPCSAHTVEMDTGYWSQTWTETLNQPKDEVADAVVSWQALESTKMLTSWTTHSVDRPLSEGLEIMLEKNPFLLQPGQKLRLLVMLKGQPYEGVTVAYDGKPRGVTGQDGRINIRIRHGGLQVLTGSLKEPPLDPKKADKLIRATTLFFTLPEQP